MSTYNLPISKDEHDLSFLDEEFKKRDKQPKPIGRPKGSLNKKTLEMKEKKNDENRLSTIDDLKRSDDYTFDIDDLPSEFPCCICSIGKSKSGKSYNTAYLIQYFSMHKPYFKAGLVMLGSKGLNDDYKWMPKDYVIDGYSEDVLRGWLDHLKSIREKTNKPPPPTFLILDDLLNAITNNDYFSNFLSQYRHYNITIFINNQTLANRTTGSLFREQTVYLFAWGTKAKNTLEHLYKWFGQLFDSFDEFKNHFLETTKEKHTCMFYDATQNDVHKNYLRWKSPENFKPVSLRFSKV